MKKKWLTKMPVVALLALLCCMLWGSAFPCIKIGYRLFGISAGDARSQILFAGIRFALAGVLVIAAGSLMRKKVLLPGKNEWHRIVFISMFHTIFQYLFFYTGLAHTTGVKASIIVGSNVFITILIACFFFHQEPFGKYKCIGCLIGFAGVVLINLNGGGMDFGFSARGEGFLFLSAASSAVSPVLIKKYSMSSAPSDPVLLSGYQFLSGGLVMSLIGMAAGGRLKFATPSQWGMLVYLAVVSAAAYSVWNILIKYNEVSKVSVFGFLNPVCGVILSTLLLEETGNISGGLAVTALFLVCTGIIIVNKRGK